MTVCLKLISKNLRMLKKTINFIYFYNTHLSCMSMILTKPIWIRATNCYWSRTRWKNTIDDGHHDARQDSDASTLYPIVPVARPLTLGSREKKGGSAGSRFPRSVETKTPAGGCVRCRPQWFIGLSIVRHVLSPSTLSISVLTFHRDDQGEKSKCTSASIFRLQMPMKFN